MLSRFYDLDWTCSISHSLKKSDSLNWTSHMDQCLQVLSQCREWEGDEVLVAIVKTQLVVDQLARAPWLPQTQRPPAPFISALHLQVQSIRNQLPSYLKDDCTSPSRFPP